MPTNFFLFHNFVVRSSPVISVTNVVHLFQHLFECHHKINDICHWHCLVSYGIYYKSASTLSTISVIDGGDDHSQHWITGSCPIRVDPYTLCPSCRALQICRLQRDVRSLLWHETFPPSGRLPFRLQHDPRVGDHSMDDITELAGERAVVLRNETRSASQYKYLVLFWRFQFGYGQGRS